MHSGGGYEHAALSRALIRCDIDRAINGPEVQDEEFRKALLCCERPILDVPDDAEQAGMGEIRFADLVGQTFVLYPHRLRLSYAEAVPGICEADPRDTKFGKAGQVVERRRLGPGLGSTISGGRAVKSAGL